MSEAPEPAPGAPAPDGAGDGPVHGEPVRRGPGRSWGTWMACLLALSVFVSSWGPGWWRGEHGVFEMIPGAVLSRWGALDLVEIWDHGAWWRVLTGAWLHGSWVHLSLNLVGLWSVGRWVEGAIGPWRMLATLFISAILGGLASLAVVEAGLVVGISGGVFGLAGALLALRLTSPVNSVLMQISPWELGFWLLLWLVVGAFAPGMLGGDAEIAQFGHIGGLVGGVVAGWWFRPTDEPGSCASRWLAGAALLGGAAVLAWVGASPPRDAESYALRGYRALEAEQFTVAAEHFSAAIAMRPDDASLLNAGAYARAEAGIELFEALSDIERALRLSENDGPEFRVNLLDTRAWILCRAGRVDEGRDQLEKVIELAERQRMQHGVFREHLDGCGSSGADTGNQ